MRIFDKIKISNAVKFIKIGKVDKALVLLNNMKSPFFEKFFYTGICYYEVGEFDKAIDNFNKAIQHKEDYNCIRILAEVYLQQDKWQMALKELNRFKNSDEVRKIIIIIKNESKREDYIKHNKYIAHAINYVRDKQYKKSICCYKEAIKYAEDKASIYNQIGAIYYNYLKDKEKAEQYFCKAYNIAPNNKCVKMNYAKIKLHS